LSLIFAGDTRAAKVDVRARKLVNAGGMLKATESLVQARHSPEDIRPGYFLHRWSFTSRLVCRTPDVQTDEA
jgi:hypothetical protein